MDMETNMPKTTPKILIIDAATGVEELRDMNAEELAQLELDNAAQAEKESAKAAVDAKVAADKSLADAEFYKALKEIESNKVA
jgi:hypothetical protein